MGAVSASGRSVAEADDHLLETMRDTYCRTSANGEVELVSASCIDIIGSLSAEMVGRKLIDCYEHHEHGSDLINAMISNNDRIEGFLRWMLHRDGRRAALEINAHSDAF